MPERFYPVSYIPHNTQTPNFYPFTVTEMPAGEQTDSQQPPALDQKPSSLLPVDSLEQRVAEETK